MKKIDCMVLGAIALGAAIIKKKQNVSGVGIVYHNSLLARDNDGYGEDEMHPIKLKDLKDRFFKLRPTDSAPVWAKIEYDRSERKYYCEKYDGNGEKWLKGDTIVWAGFYF